MLDPSDEFMHVSGLASQAQVGRMMPASRRRAHRQPERQTRPRGGAAAPEGAGDEQGGRHSLSRSPHPGYRRPRGPVGGWTPGDRVLNLRPKVRSGAAPQHEEHRHSVKPYQREAESRGGTTPPSAAFPSVTSPRRGARNHWRGAQTQPRQGDQRHARDGERAPEEQDHNR